jgi:hypothetical protein
MRGKLGTFIMALVAASIVPAKSGAMSPAQHERMHCRVIDGGKLPATSGGEAALCAAVGRAFESLVPGTVYQAEVRVISASRLAGKVTVDGRELPEQRFTSMDRPLAKSSFERFAKSLAEQAAGRSK